MSVPRRFAGRARGLIRPLIGLRIAMAVLAFPQSLSAAPPAGTGAPSVAPARPVISIATAQRFQGEMAALIRTQASDGSYALTGALSDYADYPLLASMSLDAFLATHDTSALSQAVYSIARYYTQLLSASDRDGDRLVESIAPWGGGAQVEDPGFNGLLAVDAMSLARANLELRRTMPALYWYDVSRMIARATAGNLYDPDAVYFFPDDPRTGLPIRQLSPVSALPAAFASVVGRNHLDAIVDRHLLPWTREALQTPVRGADATARAVERLVAVDVLAADGRGDAVASLRSLDVIGAATPSPLAAWATERAMLDKPLLDDGMALDLLLSVARGSGRFSDAEIVRLQSGIETVDQLLGSPATPPAPEAGDRAVRAIYDAASALRDRLQESAFWRPEDRRDFPGPDATIAARRLVDDVVDVAQRAESRLFEMRFGPVMRVRAGFAGNDAVEGEDAVIRWEIAPGTQPLQLTSVKAGVYGAKLEPVSTLPLPAQLTPGAAPIRFATRFTVPGPVRTLHRSMLILAVEDASGRRGRLFLNRSVFVNPALGIVARFPNGRTFDTTNVPIQIALRRHGNHAGVARYFWFSPSGLNLVEGNRGEFEFGEADSAVATLHVAIPSPCRPGVFPFTLKFFADDQDVGTIESSLSKPYQWVMVGPFPTGDGLASKLPPETGVGLLQTYAGTRGTIGWRPVPADACGPKDEITLGNLLPESGVAYLYTVVACAYETDIEAHLSANCPVALFVDGRRVMSLASGTDTAPRTIHLNATRNDILVKVVGGPSSRVTFTLGRQDNLATDEFNNDLRDVAAGYRELLARTAIQTEQPTETRRLVTFRYDDAGASSVAVIGSFNGWSPENQRMQKHDGSWEITLSLTPGRYAYRFLINARKQVLDPSTPLTEPDGFGGRNSVLIVRR